MDIIDIANSRLVSQQIAETKFCAVKEIVAWMGAMQAQDFAMAKWAVGTRLLDATDQTIEAAINNGEVIRTHLLRPTWHLVSADDLCWMLDLTAPRIKASLRSRHRELELSDTVVTKSKKIIEKTLQNGQHLTRKELVTALEKMGIATANNRASHLLLLAELDKLVCSGTLKGGTPTYALFDGSVSKANALTKEEALATLAKRYFTSRYPATILDFTWWSGLSASDAKRAMELIKTDFSAETIDSQVYWFPNSAHFSTSNSASVHFLPAYDEILISYKDRSATLPLQKYNKAVSNNGIFRPIIIVNGQVTGIWKRTIKKDKILVDTELFVRPNKPLKRFIEKAALDYGQFLGKTVELRR